MAIEAILDTIVKDGKNHVAYVQLIKDGKVIDTMDVKYDPDDEKEFRQKVGDRILSLDNSLTEIKSKVEATLVEVVTEKAIEIETLQAQRTITEEARG